MLGTFENEELALVEIPECGPALRVRAGLDHGVPPALRYLGSCLLCLDERRLPVEFPTATRISTATTFQIVRERDGPRPRKTQRQTILILVLLSVPDVTTGLIVAMLLVRIGNGVPELVHAEMLVLFAVPNGTDPARTGITIL